MNTIRTLGFAAVAALSLGVGAAMAQEGPNDTVSGAAYMQTRAPAMQAQSHQGTVQSGSSDVQPTSPQWQPGYGVNNEGSNG
jgi:hypothetical protein